MFWCFLGSFGVCVVFWVCVWFVFWRSFDVGLNCVIVVCVLRSLGVCLNCVFGVLGFVF